MHPTEKQPESTSTAPGKSWIGHVRSPAAVIVLVFVLIWILIMAFRWQLRAQWWAYQVTQAETPEQRLFYTARLASIRDKSLGAIAPLLTDHPDRDIRIVATDILRYCESGRAVDILLTMLDDRDPEVAGIAATMLAWRSDAREYLPTLEKLWMTDAASRWGLAVAAGRIGGSAAEQFLMAQLGRDLQPHVKAQAIDSLGLLGSRAAVPLMKEALADHREIDVPPFSQISAMRAASALSVQLASQGIDPASATRATTNAPTVADVATRWIDLLDNSPATRPTATQPVGLTD